MKVICKQCGREFELSDSEIDFYRSKGLYLPKRCRNCRQQNKEEKLNQDIKVILPEKNKPVVPLWVLIAAIIIFIITILFMQNSKPKTEQIPVAETAVMTEKITEFTPETTVPPTEPPSETAPEETSPPTEKTEVTYVLNTYRMKFHKPDCDSVSQMNWRSRKYFYGTREEAIELGYSPCGNCNP